MPFMLCQELRKRQTAAANALKDSQLIFTKLNREADIATTCPAGLECFKEKAGTARKTIGLLQQEASSVKDIQRISKILTLTIMSPSLCPLTPGGSAD